MHKTETILIPVGTRTPEQVRRMLKEVMTSYNEEIPMETVRMVLTCTNFKPDPPSRANAELQTLRVVELIAMGCVAEREPESGVECVGAMHDGQFTCWDFVDELSLYGDRHWQDRLFEYKRALE